MFLGANNVFSPAKPGTGINALTLERDIALPKLARIYKAQGIGWVAIGDQNYGEGSSREHAAMSPRYLGARAIIARSFARIHETNLKKQGLLALTFSEPTDYDRIRDTDRISLEHLESLAPDRPVTCRVLHADGSEELLQLKHSFDAEQILWFRAGSALNALAKAASHTNPGAS
jgi:aconitate hydratase